MGTSGQLAATRFIPLCVAIENVKLAVKGYLLPVLAVIITLFVWISSLAAWPSVERMLLVTLAVAIKNARLAMKRHLLTVLTLVITIFVLISSLAAWPFVERMLIVKTREAIIESANNGRWPLNLSLETRRSGHKGARF